MHLAIQQSLDNVIIHIYLLLGYQVADTWFDRIIINIIYLYNNNNNNNPHIRHQGWLLSFPNDFVQLLSSPGPT